jgi:hypothetical protein
VAIFAVRSVATKAPIVPGTVFYFGLFVQMKILALLVAALTVLGVEIALGHFAHVIFVQELALVAFFAQTTQPMLADHRFIA